MATITTKTIDHGFGDACIGVASGSVRDLGHGEWLCFTGVTDLPRSGIWFAKVFKHPNLDYKALQCRLATGSVLDIQECKCNNGVWTPWVPMPTTTGGTWTPTGTNIVISNITKANWKKNGTHVQAELECDFKKSGTEAITIGGLPFAAAQRGICLANAWELPLNQGSILTSSYVIGTNARLCITTDQKMHDLRGEGIATADAKPVRLVFDYEAVS